jgi:hypothetical protein
MIGYASQPRRQSVELKTVSNDDIPKHDKYVSEALCGIGKYAPRRHCTLDAQAQYKIALDSDSLTNYSACIEKKLKAT